MKVLLVANTGWYLYNFRAALANKLVQEGFEVKMVFPFDEFTREIEARGFSAIHWKLARQSAAPLSEFKSILDLAKIYRQEKPTLVHHFTIKPVTYGSLAASFTGIPATINSITGRGFVFLGSNAKAAYLRPLVRLLNKVSYYRLNAATTFENESDMEYFVQAGIVPNRGLHLINGVGVDTQAFHFAPQPTDEPPVVIFPGRLLWAKGVGTLVEAASFLKQRLPVRIVLVGKPDPGNPESIPEDTIHAWVQQGLIEWWGWQSDMCSIYHRSHIVVLPSMGEGLSKALLEAAACGRPIVATDVPGCKEVVIPGVTGYLVPTGQPQMLAKRLETLIRNPELRDQMGRAGRRLVEENYADEMVNEQIFKIYRELLNLDKPG